jgi:hypothetical protein
MARPKSVTIWFKFSETQIPSITRLSTHEHMALLSLTPLNTVRKDIARANSAFYCK